MANIKKDNNALTLTLSRKTIKLAKEFLIQNVYYVKAVEAILFEKHVKAPYDNKLVKIAKGKVEDYFDFIVNRTKKRFIKSNLRFGDLVDISLLSKLDSTTIFLIECQAEILDDILYFIGNLSLRLSKKPKFRGLTDGKGIVKLENAKYVFEPRIDYYHFLDKSIKFDSKKSGYANLIHSLTTNKFLVSHLNSKLYLLQFFDEQFETINNDIFSYDMFVETIEKYVNSVIRLRNKEKLEKLKNRIDIFVDYGQRGIDFDYYYDVKENYKNNINIKIKDDNSLKDVVCEVLSFVNDDVKTVYDEMTTVIKNTIDQQLSDEYYAKITRGIIDDEEFGDDIDDQE